MCGVAGAYQAEMDVETALDRIAHRGPDARGVVEAGGATLGHVRLSIQDPEPRSNQPFVYGPVTLTFVGELWNAEDLRLQLMKRGRRFETTGDTEVVAAALAAWGPKALEEMEGMFALAWTDEGRGTFLARDRFGKIPLYWIADGLLGVRWASERRAFGAEGILAEAVPPGAACFVNEQHWWDYYPGPIIPGVSFKAGPAGVLWTLRDGVHQRLVSDVPVCALVSGGLDSTLIALLAREIYPELIAYTAVYDDASEDLAAARAVCAEHEIELREVEIPEPSEETIREAIGTIEISMKTQVEIALLALPLAERISRDGFRVCVSGEGADELFGGYGSIARKASTDESYREARVQRIEKMGRADFIRLNKVFMRYGVEPRAPFLHRPLVEHVLGLGVKDCPPGKKLLKEAAELGPLGPEITRREKQTFQGGAGVSLRCEEITRGDATRFYNGVAKDLFGGIPRG